MNRRGFLLGLGAAIAAPAVVRSGILMPVRGLPLYSGDDWYVNPAAVGIGNGSVQHPFGTIKEAMDAVSQLQRLNTNDNAVLAAITVHLEQGVYHEGIVMPDASPGHGVNIRGASYPFPVIQPPEHIDCVIKAPGPHHWFEFDVQGLHTTGLSLTCRDCSSNRVGRLLLSETRRLSR